MKKGVAFISVVFYFLATCGIVINSHYCMKRLVAVQLFGSNVKVCSNCGMDYHKGNRCCHDEVKVLKMANDQNKIPVLLHDLSSLYSKEVLVSAFIVTSFVNDELSVYHPDHSPPLINQQDIYLQNGVFRV